MGGSPKGSWLAVVPTCITAVLIEVLHLRVAIAGIPELLILPPNLLDLQLQLAVLLVDPLVLGDHLLNHRFLPFSRITCRYSVLYLLEDRLLLAQGERLEFWVLKLGRLPGID